MEYSKAKGARMMAQDLSLLCGTDGVRFGSPRYVVTSTSTVCSVWVIRLQMMQICRANLAETIFRPVP